MGSTSASKAKSAVVDNNIIIDLWELECLNLLFESFDNVFIPEIIYNSEIPEEVRTKVSEFDFKKVQIETAIGYEIYAELTTNPIFKNLSIPDRTAISIAKQEVVFCTSNDGLVRKACEKFEIEYLGVLGVLKNIYTKKLINKDELIRLSRKLLETSCYITELVIENFIMSL